METKREAPETDAAEYEQDFTKAMMVESDFARKLEIERDSARELLREIRDNEVNPQDEADKFLRDGVCSELSKCREALSSRTVSCGQCNEMAKQIVALREALHRIEQTSGSSETVHCCQAALSTTPPAVVPLEDVRPLVVAAENTRHWHDTSFNPETGKTEGVIVSAKSFWTLKESLAAFTAKHQL